MGLLSKILTFPVTGTLDGLMAIARQVQKQANEQIDQTDVSVQSRLLELETLLLLGEISEEEYAEQEKYWLDVLDAQLAEQAGAKQPHTVVS